MRANCAAANSTWRDARASFPDSGGRAAPLLRLTETFGTVERVGSGRLDVGTSAVGAWDTPVEKTAAPAAAYGGATGDALAPMRVRFFVVERRRLLSVDFACSAPTVKRPLEADAGDSCAVA
eukprot:1432815-Pleurochrysis_carterae.AAC.1